MSLASARPLSSRSASLVTSEISPDSSAAAAGRGRPASRISRAFDSPIIRCSRQLTPNSAPDRPMLMNAEWNTALSLQRMTSQANATAMPPPAAGPRTVAISGCGQARMAFIRSRSTQSPFGPSRSASGVPPALRSAPDENARPAPRRTTTRTAVFRRRASKCASMPSATGWFIAFSRSGRFIVRRWMPSPRSSATRMSLLMSPPPL